MLSKAIARQNLLRNSLLRNGLGLRSVSSVPGQLYFEPETTQTSDTINDMVKHLDDRRPTFTLLYFTAGWNPVCAKIEKDYEALVKANAGYHHIRIDTDKAPKLKFYFDARVEPQFLFLINGGEAHRMVGYNFEKIGDMCTKLQELHNKNEFGYFGTTGDQWERFYDHFDKWSRHGEHDRDPFRAKYDSNADMHRGPGTANP